MHVTHKYQCHVSVTCLNLSPLLDTLLSFIKSKAEDLFLLYVFLRSDDLRVF